MPGQVIHSTVSLQIDAHALRAPVPPLWCLCQGCTLPLAISETVKMITQIQSLRHTGKAMQEWLLSGFTDITRSYIHSFSLHRNPISPVSLLLCAYTIASPLTHLCDTNWKGTHCLWIFHTLLCTNKMNSAFCICWYRNISKVPSRARLECVLWGGVVVISVQLRWLQAAEQECLPWSPHQTAAHENSKIISNLKFQRHLIFWRSTII